MRLENGTPFPAKLVSVPMDGKDHVDGFVIAKETYDISPDGVLSTAADPLPIGPDPVPTPFGVFHGELFPRKDRADLVVLGTVRLDSARAEAAVSVHLGSFSSQLRVLGDRTWVSRADAEPVPSDPSRFTEMPISYARAFGGRSQGPMGEIAWPDNPDGCGFYQTEEEAIGKPLPNIEWTGVEPSRSWRERPEVAGWGPYPMFWGLRAVQSVVLDEAKNVTGISRRMFNHAHPSMVVDAIGAGERVEIRGMRPQRITFDVPRSRLVLRWTCGRDEREAQLAIDGLFIWADQQKLVLTRRARFRYPLRPGERRFAALTGPLT